MSMVTAQSQVGEPGIANPGLVCLARKPERIWLSICTPTRAVQCMPPRAGRKSERRTDVWGGSRHACAVAENGRRRTGICPSSCRAPARRAATRRCQQPRAADGAPPAASFAGSTSTRCFIDPATISISVLFFPLASLSPPFRSLS